MNNKNCIDQEFIEQNEESETVKLEKKGLFQGFKQKREAWQKEYIQKGKEREHQMYGDIAMTYDYDNYHEKSLKRGKRLRDGIMIRNYSKYFLWFGIALAQGRMLINDTLFPFLPDAFTFMIIGIIGMMIGQVLVTTVQRIEQNYEINLREQYEKEYQEEKNRIQEEYFKANPTERELYK